MAQNHEPGRDCPRCPRLVAFREEMRIKHPGWHNAPVPSFGPLDASLLIVGLGPGLRGANATGRPFTGDWAGDLLYGTLLAKGRASGVYDERPDDGLELIDCRITNAVRCVPPANRPTGEEEQSCRPFLIEEIASMPRLRVILALGGIAHNAVLTTRKLKKNAYPFAHGAIHPLPDGPTLVDSYHCSRLNTNTRRLTEAMFHQVFDSAVAATRK
ncbi:uracil-DNA glycosylase [Telmatospirillum siberiense]|uniref:Type-5 uracil-DNA glycosylase n=1 Tax=Telmatospirillum siberiense TaxID=382514 RepID=A0A2N3PRR6_9PROT|nr:uracil-DNA glycosylase [Telmatospirillum siberiense]PKU23095.1 uracil-DNA glycosylase [Telmatospirillum siberiense]